MLLLDPASILLTLPCLFLAAATVTICSILSLLRSAMRQETTTKLWSTAGVLCAIAAALFLSPNVYWTFSLELLAWSVLAYVSFETEKQSSDRYDINADDDDSEISIATVSADAEMDHEDVMLELKDLFRPLGSSSIVVVPTQMLHHRR